MKLEMISKYPIQNQHPTPLLFIHGAMHTASCWDAHFLDYFAQHGYVSHAINLSGHGNSDGRERLRWTRIADFVEDVADTVEQLANPPILIGHSMGGFIIQKYLEDHTVPGAVCSLPHHQPGFCQPRCEMAAGMPCCSSEST